MYEELMTDTDGSERIDYYLTPRRQVLPEILYAGERFSQADPA